MKNKLIFLILILIISAMMYKNIEARGCDATCQKIIAGATCENICKKAAFPDGSGKYSCSQSDDPTGGAPSGCSLNCSCCVEAWHKSWLAPTKLQDDFNNWIFNKTCVDGNGKAGPIKPEGSLEGWYYPDPKTCDSKTKKCKNELWGSLPSGSRTAPSFFSDGLRFVTFGMIGKSADVKGAKS